MFPHYKCKIFLCDRWFSSPFYIPLNIIAAAHARARARDYVIVTSIFVSLFCTFFEQARSEFYQLVSCLLYLGINYRPVDYIKWSFEPDTNQRKHKSSFEQLKTPSLR